ncbi:MAG: hypothetical protein JRI80_00045 [Deltaproteobacteria bacterium]|nr:hypothetical protein [Deltaproteobacteria bacterium]
MNISPQQWLNIIFPLYVITIKKDGSIERRLATPDEEADHMPTNQVKEKVMSRDEK